MRVRSIKLTNIKGYRGEKTFSNLGRGVILILGRNGCGKSTLAQAVGLAIFGTRPEAFKGSAGKSLNGFISQGCSEGSIEVVTEIRSGRTLIFDVQLKAPSPEDLSPKNTVTVQVFDEAQRDEPDRVNLAAGQTLEDIAQFTKAELGLRLKPQELYARLLAPAQAGGLTEYLKKTPAKRKEQTEEILGLAPVRALAKSVRRLKTEQKKLQKELLDELSLVLEQTGQTYEAVAQLAQEHQKSKPAFESLEPFHVIACFAQCQTALFPALIEASRSLAKAQIETAQAKKARQRLETIARELTRIDQARHERNEAKKEVLRLQQEAKKAAEGQKHGLAYEASQQQATQTQEKLTEANRELTQSKVKSASLEATKNALLEQIKEQKTELEAIEKSIPAFDARRKTLLQKVQESQEKAQKTAQAVKLGLDKVRQIHLLREVVDAIHGIDITRLKANVHTLQQEANLHLLPQEARPLIEDLERTVTNGFATSSSADSGTRNQIRTWAKDAEDGANRLDSEHIQTQAKADDAQRAVENLEHEAKTQETRLKELKDSQTSHNEEFEKLGSQLQAQLKAIQASLEIRDKLQDTLLSLQETLKKEGDREAWIAWKASVSAARGLDQASSLLELKTQAAQALGLDPTKLAPLGLQLPALDDGDGWHALAQEIESRRQAASERIETSLANRNDANTRRIQELQRIHQLEQSQKEVIRRLQKLRGARASEKEFAILADSVLARLPTIVATNLVGRVSLLADEFFQGLFSQPGADLQMVWDPNDYEVTLRRGERVQPARFASGGEQMAMGIALNLAVLHYMAPETRWLVLDEPTASLDKVNRAALRDFVEQLSTGVSHEGLRLFDQLFFISHESKLFEGLGQTLNFEDAPG